jgi:hypothetical protein
MRKLPSKFDLDGLCGMLEIKPYDTENSIDYFMEDYHWAYTEAIKEGKTEDEATEAALKAESRAMDEHFKKFKGAVEATAAHFCDLHKLELTAHKNGYQWVITPKDSWEVAACAIKETINGYGMFYFRTTKEFMDSGPYTARQAVLSHLHWMKSYAAVYGDTSAGSMMERELRY